jgi:hypothetical protein
MVLSYGRSSPMVGEHYNMPLECVLFKYNIVIVSIRAAAIPQAQDPSLMGAVY